ncbi:MAG: hypothetical protein OJF60_002949 [Burkholderiaceae bacterium]|jgi:hypothetical protein|nr:MAG: hypothetical protein OJF60_002949 [Burkholderiaceae bacterium]
MNRPPKLKPVRLALLVLAAALLGGCAVYPPAGAVASGTDAYGNPIYTVPYAAPGYSYYPYYSYGYDPAYIGAPVWFGFGWYGGYHGGYWGHGHWGHGGGHWGGRGARGRGGRH